MNHESNPENYIIEENFLDDWLISIYEWVSTNEGILNYLEERYEDTKNDDEESWFIILAKQVIVIMRALMNSKQI